MTKLPSACPIKRIWPKYEDCPRKEQVPMPVCATKVNTKNVSGEYVAE